MCLQDLRQIIIDEWEQIRKEMLEKETHDFINRFEHCW